jgi:inorganic phosphate transporter, PiT family
VSFNEVIVSAVVGSRFVVGGAGMSTQKMLYTVLAWFGSLVLATGLGYGTMWVVRMIF